MAGLAAAASQERDQTEPVGIQMERCHVPSRAGKVDGGLCGRWRSKRATVRGMYVLWEDVASAEPLGVAAFYLARPLMSEDRS